MGKKDIFFRKERIKLIVSPKKTPKTNATLLKCTQRNKGSGGSSYRGDAISVVAKTDVICRLPCCFLSTPKTGYPYQIDPQLLTSNRANWYLRPLNLDKILPTSCKLSNPLFPHHNDVSRMVPAPDNERQQARVLAVISPYVTLVCCQLSRRDAISLMATR